MNTKDIKDRLERVYSSIGQRFDNNIEKNVKVKQELNGNHGRITISFGEKSKAEASNIVFAIISHLAKLKDHLKDLCVSKGRDAQLIENEIESSEYLKLIIDLDNREKHNKLKKSRSGKYPYLDEVGQALSTRTGGQTKSSFFAVDPFTGKIETKGDVVIVVTAEIKSKKGIRICSFDELINKSIEKWEEIICRYNLI